MLIDKTNSLFTTISIDLDGHLILNSQKDFFSVGYNKYKNLFLIHQTDITKPSLIISLLLVASQSILNNIKCTVDANAHFKQSNFVGIIINRNNQSFNTKFFLNMNQFQNSNLVRFACN